MLTEPNNALTKQYQQLFSIDNVELVFTPKALEAAAAAAVKRKSGARGLRSIIEETLVEVMYELPSLTSVERCIVDDGAIKRLESPHLLTASGSPVSLPLEYKLSA